MITARMTKDEMLDEVRRDTECMTGFVRHRIHEIRRHILKGCMFPIKVVYDWKSPHGTKYLLRIHIKDKSYFSGKSRECDVWPVALIDTDNGVMMFDGVDTNIGKTMVTADGVKKARPEMVTSHCVQRYGERFTIRTNDDLRKQMMLRMGEAYVSAIAPGTFQRSHGGDAEVLKIWKDGIFLGIVKDDMFVFNTFLPWDSTFTENQRKYLNEMSKLHLECKDLYTVMETMNKENRRFEV